MRRSKKRLTLLILSGITPYGLSLKKRAQIDSVPEYFQEYSFQCSGEVNKVTIS